MTGPVNEVARLGDALAFYLKEYGAVRVGESTVVSRCVHLIEVERPEEVKVLTTSDAGQVFYGRRVPGCIYHIDTFHAVSRVDHRAVAKAVTEAVKSWNADKAACLLDHMDIQTGTGGGRVSGSLNFGRSASLRRAHANHVHIAAEITPESLPVLVPVVAAVEAEVMRQGTEIRKVERIVLRSQRGQAGKVDLSPYASASDSLLREDKASPARANTSPGVNSRSRDWESIEWALELTRETLPPQELARLLESLPLGPQGLAEHQKRWGDLEHALSYLEERRLIRRQRGRFTLTPEGHDLALFLNQHLPELESRFRQILRHVPLEGTGRVPVLQKAWDASRSYRADMSSPEKMRAAAIDLSATVFSAARRWVRGARPGSLEVADLRYAVRKHRRQARIVLLLDTSASMAGERLRAARCLAEHLVLATHDKVAVIAFQEQEVLVPSGFTSRLTAVERQLLALRAYGLTPLARALQETAIFLRQTRVRNPLVFLITDGIPTVPLANGDPAEDALRMAEELGKMHLQLICIGLDPNRRFLEDLCGRANGRLHVIKELEPAMLARLVHGELTARLRRGNC